MFIDFNVYRTQYGTPCRLSRSWVHYQYSALAKLQNTGSLFNPSPNVPVSLARSLQNKSHTKSHFQQNSCQPVTSQLLQNSLFMLPKAIWWDVQGWVILDFFAYLRTHLIFSTFPILLWGFSGTFRPQENKGTRTKGSKTLFPLSFSLYVLLLYFSR